MIDPEPCGDPEAIRALAREIAARADLVGDTPAGFAAALAAATFESTAATRLRAGAADARRRAADLAAEVREIAAQLFADATSVEAQNADAAASATAAQDGTATP
ncbi:MAG: hypothetical protein QOD69_3383 [Solirubrobacteraceae bacterium]|jgi:hypothetical protein|nr:hypothetical protein [Solirubrobacteraceae bacterium]